MEKQLLRVDEAAQVLAVSRWTIYRWVEEGRLRATKIGKGSLRIFYESLAGLVDKNQVDTGGRLTDISGTSAKGGRIRRGSSRGEKERSVLRQRGSIR